MGQHPFELDAAATTVPYVANDRARHRAYAEAVHFMRRSGREDVKIGAIVALVAYVRKAFKVPLEQLVEDGYWELVAQIRNGNDQVDDWPLPSEGSRKSEFELVATLKSAGVAGGRKETKKPPYREQDNRTLGEILDEAFNRKRFSENCECEDRFKPPLPRKAGGQRFTNRSLHGWDPRMQVMVERQDLQAQVLPADHDLDAAERFQHLGSVEPPRCRGSAS